MQESSQENPSGQAFPGASTATSSNERNLVRVGGKSCVMTSAVGHLLLLDGGSPHSLMCSILYHRTFSIQSHENEYSIVQQLPRVVVYRVAACFILRDYYFCSSTNLRNRMCAITTAHHWRFVNCILYLEGYKGSKQDQRRDQIVARRNVHVSRYHSDNLVTAQQKIDGEPDS